MCVSVCLSIRSVWHTSGSLNSELSPVPNWIPDCHGLHGRALYWEARHLQGCSGEASDESRGPGSGARASLQFPLKDLDRFLPQDLGLRELDILR